MYKRSVVVSITALVLLLVVSMVHLMAGTPPVAIFTHTPESPLVNETVVFNASDSYDPDGYPLASYTWNFGDGSSPVTLLDPTTHYSYTVEGNYNVTLTVTDNEALNDTTWTVLTVRKHPVANFTYSPSYPLEDEVVTFNASLSTPNGGTIVSYQWNFGDGNSVNVTNPITTHNYTAVGNYTVILTVKDSENLTGTCSQTVRVRGYPVVSFTYSPSYPLEDELVTFDASASTPNGGTIISYDWNFGDGYTGTGVIVNHTYTDFGNYNATLNVTDSEGLSKIAWNIVAVRKRPVAVFTYSPAQPLVNEVVTFNASLSTPNGGTIISYAWRFGDGATGTGVIVNHTYSSFGNYSVTLNVTDSEGLFDVCQQTVRVLINPVANFTYSPATPVVNETVTFNASASYDPDFRIVSYRWDFGDSNVTTVDYPIITHAYGAAGTYNVTLTVTDTDSLTGQKSKLITIYSFLYVHDVAIVNVTPSATNVFTGTTINITVVARNEGTAVETFTVTTYYGSVAIGTETIISMLPDHTEKTLTFTWDTTGVYGTYTISANASVVHGEVDVTDNSRVDGTVTIRRKGDANGDGHCDGFDFTILNLSWLMRKGDPLYDPKADLNGDDTVDGYDFTILNLNWLTY